MTLENIYGGDIDNISVCIARINLALKFRAPRRELLYGHICVNDYLSVEMAVHFDYIIGNPPWVTNSTLSLLESKNTPKKKNLKRLFLN